MTTGSSSACEPYREVIEQGLLAGRNAMSIWQEPVDRGTTKRQVSLMFAEEKPALQPLPIEPFRYYQYGDRSVNLDGCVEVEAAYYSAPPGWISRRGRVQLGRHLCAPAGSQNRPAAARASAP